MNPGGGSAGSPVYEARSAGTVAPRDARRRRQHGPEHVEIEDVLAQRPISAHGPAPVVDRRGFTVLHVTQPVTEGVGNYVRQLVTRLPALGHRVGLACPPNSELAEAARSAGVEVLPFIAGREPSLAIGSEVRQIRGAFDHFAPDLVHLHSSKAGMAGRLAIRGRAATVFQPHAWSFEAADGLVGLAARRWERHAVRWTDAIITVSDAERRLAAPHAIAAEHDTTIPNPVDVERFRPVGENEQAAIRARLGLSCDVPVVVCVGRLCEQKGQDILLGAWPRVLDRAPDAMLLLVGDGPSRAALESTGAVRTRFLGDRDDVPDMLRIADVVAMPSRWEGMSLAMLEAMATARPVVASDVGGSAETIGLGAGAVVPVGDEAALAAEILLRLSDTERARTEGRNGRSLVVDRHSVESNLQSVEALYGRVSAGRAPTQPSPIGVEPGR